ncbi:unnamed protein product [Amoebophrya sp. A25]|nr:unnamed protein product [Amoebophrya sp. A25]|eukprot:GSA25T00007106001.1
MPSSFSTSCRENMSDTTDRDSASSRLLLRDLSHDEVFKAGESCLFTVADGVAHLQLARPKRLNALNQKTVLAIWKALDETTRLSSPEDATRTNVLGQDDTQSSPSAVRVFVLSAQGKYFCSGADAQELMASASSGSTDETIAKAALPEDVGSMAQLWEKLSSLPVPTIAIAQGSAFGGGVGLLSCCDIVIASAGASFALSEVRIGMTPATIAPHVISKMGNANARRYFLTGEPMTAENAKQIGLVTEVAPKAELQQKLDHFLKELTKCAPKATQASKRLLLGVQALQGNDANQLVRKFTQDELDKIRKSPEVMQGAMAMLSKSKKPWEEQGLLKAKL